MTTYYFAIASKDFLLIEEPLEEVLRERTNHYQNIGKDLDFWLIIDPAFINAPNMLNIKKQLIKPSAAIISKNPKFIDWLKLRFGFILTGQFEAPSGHIKHPLQTMQ
uniref:Ycf54 n=1 Tax=Dichotomaria marginata TaxID=268567 RepID=A0A1G4NS79_9FLOR|nr:Hypothetical protein ycf54 [Dichotomaria marginata]SCW21465.1 Hypothetical protein ycf54 [Dichotomaria marginata]